MAEFTKFPKLYRLRGPVIVSEKLDGTNAQIYISDDGATFLVGSRTRYITPESDNQGFARWAYDHKTDLMELLGPGTHYGEWMGKGIQRGYGLQEKRFYLFNTTRWNNPDLLDVFMKLNIYVVPVLYAGVFDTSEFDRAMNTLKIFGSFAITGYMNPEGIVIYDTQSGVGWKKTFDYDTTGKNAPRDIDNNVLPQPQVLC